MKKLLFLAVTAISLSAFAQEDKEIIIEKKGDNLPSKKQSQEIIIRKKGDKDIKITVEIKDNTVTINGKPLSEFKEGDVTINQRKIKIWDGHNDFSFSPEDMDIDFTEPFTSQLNSTTKAFLGVSTEEKNGAVIIDKVTPASAAEKAGLKQGDILTKINDKKIESPESLSQIISSFKPKDEVTVYYTREGKEKTAKALLGQAKTAMAYTFRGPNGNVHSFNIPPVPPPPPMPGEMPQWDRDGMQGFRDLKELNNMGNRFPRHQKLGLKIQDMEEGDGVKILDTDKDSPAEKAGLQKEDIITEIAGNKISNTDDAREQLQENADKQTYNIKVNRKGSPLSFDIKIPKKLKTANL